MENAVMKELRADKLLTAAGYGSRTEVKKLIRAGRLLKNGTAVQRPEEKLDPERDVLTLDGRPFEYKSHEYWVLNKPAGILSATEDRHRETVISYMGLTRKNMAPCGRLDLDTEGLLLVTDDGALVHRLLAPGKQVDKEYEVYYSGTLPADATEHFASGIELEDGTLCRPALLSGTENPTRLTIQEGKFHQVKRMFQALGCTVTKLKRLRMGPLSLSDLKLTPGTYRQLTEEELRLLKDFEAGRTAKAPAEKMSGPGTELPRPEDYAACIFDLDGTLVDSMWMWHELDQNYLARFGIEYPDDLQLKIAGMSFPEVADYFKERFQLPDDVQTMMRDWEEMAVLFYRSKVPPKPGAVEFLRALRTQKKRIAIATSNAMRMVNAVLESLEIRDYFEIIVTASEVNAGKPKPDIYLEAARRLNLSPAHCLVFEDIPEGILAGKRAGMTVCAVRDSFSEAMEEEKRTLSDYMITDYRELL